jgi:hypothetical protein
MAGCKQSHDDGGLDIGEKGKQPLSLVERTTVDVQDAETVAGGMAAGVASCHQPLDLTKDSIRLVEIPTSGPDGSNPLSHLAC